ncbi:MAG: MFS transporter [Planctomycetes bacterium]|nr:MFS transporter [Planctomycetota bacterium]
MSAKVRNPRESAARYAWYVLTVLTFINFINYVDRYIFASCAKDVEISFNLNRTQIGLLQSAFFLPYLLSPLIGYLGDRIARRGLLAVGVFLWSIATLWSAIASDFWHLWIARAATGVGELCYGIIAPAFLSDLFSKERRARTLAWFYVALPVGTAAGYALGGYVGQHTGHTALQPHNSFLCSVGIHEGWRHAFLIGGFPGIVLCILTIFLREPQRGAMEAAEGPIVSGKIDWQQVRELLKTKSFLANVFATTAMTFAIGGLAQWAPTYLQDIHHYTSTEAGTYFGIIIAIAGSLGTAAGGTVSDWARKYTRAAHFVVPAITLILSAIFLFLGLYTTDKSLFWGFCSASVFLMFCNSGPLNAAVSNVSMPAVRATAFAIMIFTIHVLGDASSPWLIGRTSDYLEKSRGFDHSDSLRWAVQLAPPVMFLGGVVLLICAKYLPLDMASMERRLHRERRGRAD